MPGNSNVVDVPEPISTWLASYGVLSSQTSVLSASGSKVCQHSAKEWSDVRNGFSIGTVLTAFFRSHGQQSIIPKLRQGGELKVRLHNWNLLAPFMSTFGVDLTSDVKTLVVAGEEDELLTLLYSLCKRVGNGSGAGQGGSPAAGGESKAAEEEAEEKLDRSELWKGSLMQIAGLYSIMVACLLSIFIQQDCSSTSCSSTCLPGGGAGPSQVCTTVRSPCSFQQNLRLTSGFGKLTIAFNFITLFVFLASQAVFYYREKFVVDAFSEDTHLSVENLQEEVKLYPRFKDRLQNYNQASVWLSSTLLVFLIVNLVLSSINILRFHYAGKASVIGLISNTGLVLVKVLNWFSVGRQSSASDVAISFFDTRNRAFNAISPRWRFDPDEYKPTIGVTHPQRL